MAKNPVMQRKGCNPALAQKMQEQRDALLIRGVNKANVILTLMVLGDEFDFTPEQMNNFMERYYSELDAYKQGYVERATDFEQVIREEYGIEIKF